MSKKSHYEIGLELEDLIVDYLKEIDTKARRTKASGSSTKIADVLNKYFYIEAKKINKENLPIKRRVWYKLCNKIPINSLKIPLYILQNIFEETFVVLQLEDFINLFKETVKELKCQEEERKS